MGLWNKLSGELIDIIQWIDNSQDILIYRFERYGNEIKHGAKLIVRETQVAVLINEGKIEDKNNDGAGDVFSPGTYTLETKNLPILSTLQGWKYGFNSPFKAEVYFVNTKHFLNQGWGTKNPFTIMDSILKKPIRLKAYGNYSFRITDPIKLIKTISGTNGIFDIKNTNDQFKNIIISRFTDTVASSGVSAFNMAQNYDEFSKQVCKSINNDFSEYGIEVTNLNVENISMPPEVEAAIDKGSSIGIIGDMNQYNSYQAGHSLEQAVENPSNNISSEAMDLGMGIGFGAMINRVFQSPTVTTPQQNITPPPLPVSVYYVAIAGQPTGPFDANTLKTMTLAGTFSKDSLVWKQGMPTWVTAKDVEEFTIIFNSVPPPIPKQ